MLDRTEEQLDSPEVRLQKLVVANRAIVAEQSLDALLRRVVRSAREIVGAEYAALWVVGADGTRERFLHEGMDADAVARIGRLPEGRGLLGALLRQREPIRLRSLADHPRSLGVPAGHPPVTSFLGVPICSAASVYGNLYLANRTGQAEFSTEDQDLVTALAATASIAIENVRLHEQSQRRQEWLLASADVSHRLLASGDQGPVLADIAGSVCSLMRADAVTILLPAAEDVDQMVAQVVAGTGYEGLQGLRVSTRGSQVQRVMAEAHAQVLEGFEQRVAAIAELASLPPIRHVVALPLQGAGWPRGAIVAVRMADLPFSSTDLVLAEGFVSQAGLALELADARTNRHKLALLEDRAQIARDLHDHVVQKLFAAGLMLQGTATMVKDAELRRRLTGAVDNLDDTIRTIRTSIFELHEPQLPGASVRKRVLSVLAALTPVLGFAPLTTFDGPLDTMVDEELGKEVEAVLRESLTNAAKHAGASAVTVDLATTGRTLTLSVSDDGVGLRPSGRRSGLSNLRYRAERRGGRLDLGPSPEGGLSLCWSIPLPS